MAKPLPLDRLKRVWLSLKRTARKGFTLTELLVAIIVAAIITVLLLAMVVELTQTNQQDAARSQIQQDMQAAMDFMAQDLREAVFVYNGECLQGNGTPTTQDDLKTICPGIVNYIPVNLSSASTTPVLAFWRTKSLPPSIQALCKAEAPNLADEDPQTGQSINPLVLAGVPCLAGTNYSLVVYSLDTTNPNNIWRGKARLTRYELSMFPADAADQNDKITGYVNPLERPTDTFQQWPFGITGTAANSTFQNRQTARPTNPAFTLVDFVDDVGAVGGNAVTPSCEEFAPFPGGNPANPKTLAAIDNALSPKTDSPNTNNRRGFYACVRNGGIGDAAGSGENQDVLLTLIGNVTGQGGFSRPFDNSARLSPLQTRVLVRGAVRKINPTS